MTGPQSHPIPVCLAVHGDVSGLIRTLKCLRRSTGLGGKGKPDLRVFVWNNALPPEHIRRASDMAGMPIFTYHSPVNVGPFGRFSVLEMALRHDLALCKDGRVVFLDDDWSFDETAIAQLIEDASDRLTLVGHQAYQFEIRNGVAEYYHRVLHAAPHYVGMSGAAAPTYLFLDEATRDLIMQCPDFMRFGTEDLWVGWVASQAGYRVKRSEAQFTQEDRPFAAPPLYQITREVRSSALAHLIRTYGWPIPDRTTAQVRPPELEVIPVRRRDYL